jgi:four helix bundle protein
MRPEKIRMWRAAEELIVEIDVIVARVRSQAANSAYHLERSGESVLFNIAEGVGAYPPKVKIAAYEVAKKEASEVRAVLRRLVLRRLTSCARPSTPSWGIPRSCSWVSPAMYRPSSGCTWNAYERAASTC